MKSWLLIFLLFLFLGCEHPESKNFKRFSNHQISIATTSENQANEPEYKVIRVKDGDTFVILMNGKEQTVRFAHIDCPEKKQPFGKQAKQFVSDMCFGSYITLVVNKKNKFDRYKRLIAEIILKDGRNLNKEIIKNGLAWHFKKYSDNEEYSYLENHARKNRIGIWSQSHPIAPWEWRKSKHK